MKGIIEDRSLDNLVAPKIVPMEPIPAESNPFHYDMYHMGVNISNCWMAMFATTREVNGNDLNEMIMVNQKTGQRFKIELPQAQ